MTKYQEEIFKDIKSGAKLQCSEGSDWKAWLNYTDGTSKKVNRRSAEIVCDVNSNVLSFGNNDGISYKPNRMNKYDLL